MLKQLSSIACVFAALVVAPSGATAPSTAPPAGPVPSPGATSAQAPGSAQPNAGGPSSGASGSPAGNPPGATPPGQTGGSHSHGFFQRLLNLVPRLGVDVGGYYPFSAKTRDRFGANWIGISPGIGDVLPLTTRGSFGPHLGLDYQSSGDDYIVLLPIGVSYTRAIVPSHRYIPYFTVTADAYPNYFRSPSDGINGGIRLAWGGSATVGVTLGPNAWVDVYFKGISPIDGYDFSGLGISASYRFLKL